MGRRALKRRPSTGRMVESRGSLDGDGVERRNELLGEDGVGDVNDIGVKEGAGVAHADEVHPVDEGLGAELLEEGRLGGIGLGALLDELGVLDL